MRWGTLPKPRQDKWRILRCDEFFSNRTTNRTWMRPRPLNGTRPARVGANLTAGGAAATATKAVPIFWSGLGGVAVYRIPALVRVAGELLAFAEARPTIHDSGRIRLVFRRRPTAAARGARWRRSTLRRSPTARTRRRRCRRRRRRRRWATRRRSGSGRATCYCCSSVRTARASTRRECARRAASSARRTADACGSRGRTTAGGGGSRRARSRPTSSAKGGRGTRRAPAAPSSRGWHDRAGDARGGGRDAAGAPGYGVTDRSHLSSDGQGKSWRLGAEGLLGSNEAGCATRRPAAPQRARRRRRGSAPPLFCRRRRDLLHADRHLSLLERRGCPRRWWRRVSPSSHRARLAARRDAHAPPLGRRRL